MKTSATDQPETLASLVTSLVSSLESLRDAGCRGFDCTGKSRDTLNSWDQPLILAVSLPALERSVSTCRKCSLWKHRKRTVFGSGNPEAKLMFIGEGPGYDEDREGKPFVGKAGELLTKMISAMKLSRDEIYICNVVKCHPPKNRNPLPEEIETCIPYLHRQIELIQPEFICTLGAISSRALLNSTDPISSLRGKFNAFQGIPVLPTYHPAYLLRNPAKKRESWEDLQLLMKKMGIPT